MVSVTQRIQQIKQPRGGYLNLKDFNTIKLNDKKSLFENENIHSSLVGLAVDYLSRFINGTDKRRAFHISLQGAMLIDHKEIDKSFDLLNLIVGLDDASIINACKLVGYDVCFRADSYFFKPIEDINPNSETIFNIRTMVHRCETFFKEYGPVIKDGMTFEGAYTHLVDTGDADFLTKDTLWDIKVSKFEPKPKHTLQLLMYFLMAKKTKEKVYKNVYKIGFFNPRLNQIFCLDTTTIDKEIIDTVKREVIGYK
jgi:hypothetical protein